MVADPKAINNGTVRSAPRVNAHTHMYSGLAPLGMPAPAPEPENFVQILERVWWRLDRALDEASLRASARLYAAEAALNGTTVIVDHHESPNFVEGSLDVLADAVDEIGLRALVCYGATERNGGREEARRGLEECRRFIEAGPRARVIGMVGLHASFTCGDETIREAGALCASVGALMHVHVAEDGADVEDARERGYDGPLERLMSLGALPSGSIAAHGVHLSADQVRAARDAGIWFVQNPRSNAGNRVGYPSALAASERVALGTDGFPSDMAAEAAALREAAAAHDDGGAGGRAAAGLALAEAFWGPTVREDAVHLDGEGNVRHVVVDGRFVVRDGQLTGADIDAIRREAAEQAERLWKRMAAL